METTRVPQRLPDTSPYFVQDRDSLPDSHICAKLDSILSGNEEGVDALQTADTFTEETDEQFLEQTEALARRIKYDNDYIAKKQQQAADKIADNAAKNAKIDEQRAAILAAREHAIKCLNPPPPPEGDDCDPAVSGAFGEVGTYAQGKYGQTEDSVRNTFNGINNDYGEVVGFYEAYERMLKEIEDSGLTVGELPAVPSGHANLDAAGTLPHWNIDIQAQIEAKIAAARQAQKEAYEKRMAAITNYDNGIGGVQVALGDITPAGEFDDYDPPSSEGTELEDYRASRDAYMDELQRTLKDAKSADVGQIEGKLEKRNSSTVGFVNETASGLNLRDFDFFTYPDIFAKDFFDGWNRIADLGMLLDITFRCFRTVQIIRKYWNISAVSTPPGE
jgi:hypothetical protein